MNSRQVLNLNDRILGALGIFVFVLLAVSFGGLLGASAYFPAFLLIGLIGAALILLWPRAIVWIVVVGAVIFSGLVELYAPQFQLIRWAFALLSGLLMGVVLFRKLFSEERESAKKSGQGLVYFFLYAIPVCVIVSAIAGQNQAGDAIVGAKNYLQMWGVVLAFGWLNYSIKESRRFIEYTLILAILQLPFVLHQFVYLVPLRSNLDAAMKNIVAVDIVAGTFGGNMNGGGRSSNLALLVSYVIVYLFARWKYGRTSFVKTIILSCIVFIPIVLNEAKIAIVIIPVGLALLFRKNLILRPFSMLLGGVLLSGVMVGLMLVYAQLPGSGGKSVEKFLNDSIAYNIGDKGYGSATLNRTTVYSFWWSEHERSGNYRGLLFGHGPGVANNTSTLIQGNSPGQKYRGDAIGLTAVSSLLWDLGLVGCACVVGLFFSAIKLASNLSREWQFSSSAPEIESTQIAMVLIAISLLHNNFFVFDMGFQAMFAVMLGFLLAMAKNSPTQ